MKSLPEDHRLRLMWQVAVTSAIAGQGEAYKNYARMIYQYLTDTEPKIYLDTPITKEQYNETKNKTDS